MRYFFWRWPSLFQGADQDGKIPWVTAVQPRFANTQHRVKDETQRTEDTVKIGKDCRKYYITQREVISLIHVFSVTNGVDYIRMVYNITSRGINDYLWAPHLAMTSVSNTLRDIDKGTS